MGELIGFKADTALKAAIDEFAAKYFQGNRSMVMKLAIEQFMESYQTDSSSQELSSLRKEVDQQIQSFSEEIQSLSQKILVLESAVAQLIQRLPPSSLDSPKLDIKTQKGG